MEPKFSARSLLDIGLGGSKVAGIPNSKVKSRAVFGRRNGSLPTQSQSPKFYHPLGKATEI